MTKNSIHILIFFLFVNVALGQSEEVKKLFEPTETDSLYIVAIENFTKQVDTLKNENKSKYKGPKVIYLQHENYLSRIPKTINGYQIIRLGLANQKEHFRKNKNCLTLVEVSPLTIKDGLFSIILVTYGAKFKGKYKMDMSYSSWNTTYFKFVNEKLMMDNYKSGGI